VSPPTLEITGAEGTVVSIVALAAGESVVEFPAASVSVGAKFVVPSAKAVFGVQATLVPVAGLGEQVHPGIVTVSPTEVTITTSGVVSLVL